MKVGRQKSRLGARKSKVCSWFLRSSESDVWQFGLRAAGPVRPSLPCILALRGGPWPGAVQDESWQAKSRLGARKSKV